MIVPKPSSPPTSTPLPLPSPTFSELPYADDFSDATSGWDAGSDEDHTRAYEDDQYHITIVKELIKHDVIVLTTGCNAITCGKVGLLTPESAKVYCGSGLAEVCETVGIPPVLHMGSCVDIHAGSDPGRPGLWKIVPHRRSRLSAVGWKHRIYGQEGLAGKNKGLPGGVGRS